MSRAEKTRYILEYVPSSVVGAISDKHRQEIDEEGASVWDFVQPEDVAQTRKCKTEADALQQALLLLPLDEFGEIHVFEQHPDKFGGRNSWETFRRAVVYPEDIEIQWEDVRK